MNDAFKDKTLKDAEDIRMRILNPEVASFHSRQTHDQLYAPAPVVGLPPANWQPPPRGHYGSQDLAPSSSGSPSQSRSAPQSLSYSFGGASESIWEETISPLFLLSLICLFISCEWLLARQLYPKAAEYGFSALAGTYSWISELVLRIAHHVHRLCAWAAHQLFDPKITEAMLPISDLALLCFVTFYIYKSVSPIAEWAMVSRTAVLVAFLLIPVLILGVFLFPLDVIGLARLAFRLVSERFFV